jgi:hypothetical protein
MLGSLGEAWAYPFVHNAARRRLFRLTKKKPKKKSGTPKFFDVIGGVYSEISDVISKELLIRRPV